MISCYDEEQDSLYLRWRFGMAHGAMRIFFNIPGNTLECLTLDKA
jgi:hypothetical protein